MLLPSPARSLTTLSVATEAVLRRDPSGRIWAAAPIGAAQWNAHLEAFDRLRLVARVTSVGDVGPDAMPLDHDRLSVLALPAYKGLARFLAVFPRLVRLLWTESRHADMALLVLPGPIGSLLGLFLATRRRPYGVQLVGDIDAVYETSAFALPTKLTQPLLSGLTRFLCRTAKAIAYVTRSTLQTQYPSGATVTAYAFSNVQLPASLYAAEPRRANPSKPIRLIFCGSLAQPYKGLDVLIAAARLLVDRNLGFSVTVVGDGIFRTDLQQMAVDQGLANCFAFVGQVPRETVLAMMEVADLFVLPSRTEGLPRALVEAMAKGLPCIASRVGGVPELLADSAMVPPNNPAALAAAIARFADNPALRDLEAARNLRTAHSFESTRLDTERYRFVGELRRIAGQR